MILPPFFGYIRLLLHRAKFYDMEYGIALDTAFLVLAVLLLIFFYADMLNRKDKENDASMELIRQSEDKYRSLVHAMKEGVIYFDTTGAIIFYNEGFSAITGYGISDLIGKEIIEVFSTNDNVGQARQRLQERAQGRQEDYEWKIRHKDGSVVDVAITSRVVLDNENKVTACFSTVVDITERKKREEDLEAFSGSAAHDLNAPLARVEMLSRFLVESAEDRLTEEELEYLHIIIATNINMRALLRDLLDFSKMGYEKMVKEEVDMERMANEVFHSLAYVNPVLTITIGKLPKATGSPGALQHVWANLISNAVKYSSKKSNAEVEISAVKAGEKVTYMVRDNGAGFSMADAGKLFAPFKRLHSDFEGNGLGLPIVKRIVEKHGGKIWAESTPGNGATFYFTL